MKSSNDSSEILQRLAREKARRGPVDPWTWFMAYRRLRGLAPDVLHALVAIINDPAPVVVIQKAAQMGVTELLVSLALWAADTAYAGRGNVLYLMPTKGQMEDFVQSRFDAAIQESDYLRGRIRPDPPGRKGADNKQVKRIGNGYIFFRGAESSRMVSSVDADLVIMDEFDQMAHGTYELAMNRIASSQNGRIVIASTPRIPGAGINSLYLESDRNRYHLPCPACGLEQPLEWDENVDQEAVKIVCSKCGAGMDRSAVGRWVAASDRSYHYPGYHISQLYSPWLDLRRLIGLSKRPGIHAREEFHNSHLGVPFVAENGGIQLADLDAIAGEYSLDDYNGEPCVMGVDVGGRYHVVIREDISEPYPFESPYWGRRLSDRTPKLWFAGDVPDLDEVKRLADRFGVQTTVIDALPEIHLVTAFANKNRNVHVAYYRHNSSGYEWISIDGRKPRHVKADRLKAMDEMYDRVRQGTVTLPAGARELGGHVNSEGYGEYAVQMMAPQRVYEKDVYGNVVAKWVDNGRDDHYAHAEVYCMLAQKWGIGISLVL